jgi:predicted MFS family arabinose efflux permease
MSPSTIGTIASLGRLIAVLVVLLEPQLIRQTNNGSVAMWASLATALCLVPIALAHSWWGSALVHIGTLAATNLRCTTFIVYIMVLVPQRQQAVMVGTGEAAAGISFALMALGGGYVITLSGFRELFLLGALITGLGTFLFWMHLRSVNVRRVTKLGSVP